MSKSRFRILAFRCLSTGNIYYANRMQRSLQKKQNEWYKFKQDIVIGKDAIGKPLPIEISIPNDAFRDEELYKVNDLCLGISAIVGENGSGKSSILDMMIRILNNASTALLGEKPLYDAAEHLHYIQNVHGQILFIQDEKIRLLTVKDYDVFLMNYNSDNRTDNDCKKYVLDSKYESYWLRNISTKREELVSCNKKEVNHLGDLFYTIVCNYSLYAYNPSDYHNEYTVDNKLDKISPKPKYNENKELKCWLSGLFYKNDGYQMPVVISPMRTNGTINASSEEQLAKERILSMLFYKDNKNGQKEFEKYPFRIINQDHIIMALSLPDISNYMKDNSSCTWEKNEIVKKGLFSKDSNIYKNFDKISDDIKEYFNSWNDFSLDLYTSNSGIAKRYTDSEIAKRYIVYKIIKISCKYKRYSKFKRNLASRNYNTDILIEHLDELMSDTSHITIKLRRALMYFAVPLYRTGICDKNVFRLEYIEEQARSFLEKHKSVGKIQSLKIEDLLPPPCFRVEFQIVKKEDINEDGNYNDTNIIPFGQLSSGEKQIAFTISNFVYHLVNIDSVHKTNIKCFEDKLPLLKYKYINAIFDEIELYFHPDLQRRFLSLLVSALNNVTLEHIEGINILMVTHSPFVLSDIPRTNVLALSQSGKDIDQTFCANIHEMLGNSFFMEYSIGKIAQEKVESIMRIYNEFSNLKTTIGKERFVCEITEDEWNHFDYIKEIVADEYLRNVLETIIGEMKSYLKTN